MKIDKNKNYMIYTIDNEIFFVKGENLEISDGLVSMIDPLFNESVCTQIFFYPNKTKDCFCMDLGKSIPLTRIAEIVP